MAAIPAPAARGMPVAMGMAALPDLPPLADAAAELAAAEMLLRADLRAPLAEEAAEAAALEAEAEIPDAADAAEAAEAEAAEAALPVRALKTVLKPVVVATALPAELVTVATRAIVVTAVL